MAEDERETVAVAGATGNLGREVVRVLLERGYRVRSLARTRGSFSPDVEQVQGDLLHGFPPDSLAGVSCLVVCAGAPTTLDAREPKARFESVDWEGNRGLIELAERAGVERVVYVSLCNAHLFLDTEYARAHEKMVGAVRHSSMLQTVVRPTGFFSAWYPLVEQARRTGRVTIIGDGSGRINPIAEEDAAIVIADAVRDQPTEVSFGGPEVLTRESIAELACAAAGVTPRVRHVPAWLANIQARVVAPFRPRTAAMLRFHAAANDVDRIADAKGTRTINDAFTNRS